MLIIVQYIVGLFQAFILLVIIMLSSFHRKNRNASTIIYFLMAIISITFSSLQAVNGHGNGAPKSRCGSMIPGHWVNAQEGLSPYQILVDKSVISPGDRVNITLKTIPGQTGFKGFFVMVKEVGEDENAWGEDGEGASGKQNQNFGVFDLASSEMNHAQPVHCFEQRNSAMTHVVNYVKDSVELYWIAPKLISDEVTHRLQRDKDGTAYMEKELKIVATFVRDFWTYWANVEPVGDVRLLLTDTFQPKSPKISPKLQASPSSKLMPPQFRGNDDIRSNNHKKQSPGNAAVQLDSDGASSWTHFKRAWNFMVDLFGPSKSA